MSTRPPDFDAFWERTVGELRGVPHDATTELVEEPGDSRPALERVSFRSLGGALVRGYLLRWTDGADRPLVVHSHGYGSACEVRWEWAKAGLNVLGVDIRGCGISADAVPHRSRWGYILTGIESPETSILRGAVCDYMRAVEVGTELLKDRTRRLVLHGISFAGGLALMAEANLQRADLLAVGVPTFGWAEGRHFFVKIGSGAEIVRYLEARPEVSEDVMLVLRYFDTMNFAGKIRCPALVGVGLADDVVPAKTVFAIVNHLAGPHQVMEFPVSHSDHPDERLWSQFEDRWIHEALHACGDDFEPPEPTA